jgi:nicotinate-nucleotide--dimethylbenzimidazole phosphoribosyltransferase
MSRLDDAIRAILPLDGPAMAAAGARQAQLTKPAGSLGRLEDLAVQLAGIRREPLPLLRRKTLFVVAADHGVAAEGVSVYPQAVTAQMVQNFLQGGAACNVLARVAGARVVVVDAGVAADVAPLDPSGPSGPSGPSDLPGRSGRSQPHTRFVAAKIAQGTQNLATGPAMTREQARRAIDTGLRLVDEEHAAGLDAVALGEMGIANTTASSCVVAALTGAPVAAVTGRGTGLEDTQLAHKRTVVERALAVNAPDPADALDVLAKVGGFEIAALAGVAIGAAARGVAVVVDGFIAGAAALAAARLAPAVVPYLIAAHRSVEPGHAVVLDALGLHPLLDLGLRLGEGTGALLAFPILDAACLTLAEMATFDSAGVSTASEASER